MIVVVLPDSGEHFLTSALFEGVRDAEGRARTQRVANSKTRVRRTTGPSP
jgi:hypothetical protein